MTRWKTLRRWIAVGVLVLVGLLGIALAVRSWMLWRDQIRMRRFLSGDLRELWAQSMTHPDLREGRWKKGSPDLAWEVPDGVPADLVERLESIGYAGGSIAATGVEGVTVHDRTRVRDGLNLLTSGHRAEAELMDMDGRILHTWSKDFWEIWPKYPFRRNPNTKYWRKVHLFENGDLLAIYEGLGMVKLDRQSRVLWKSPCRAHHDLEVLADGRIVTLTRRVTRDPFGQGPGLRLILEDFITILDPGGRLLKEVSLLDCFKRSPVYLTMLRQYLESHPTRKDPFHTNTIRVLDGRLADQVPYFRKGRVLISLRFLNLVAVVDLDERRIVWSRLGSFKGQHDTQILENGHLLLFDNLGLGESSRVLEVDPATLDVLWSYEGTADHPFFSETCGTVQRLPDNDTLITESDPGRAFEVTPDGTIVWEYRSPHRSGDHRQFVATLFELERLPPGFSAAWIAPEHAAVPGPDRSGSDAGSAWTPQPER